MLLLKTVCLYAGICKGFSPLLQMSRQRRGKRCARALFKWCICSQTDSLPNCPPSSSTCCSPLRWGLPSSPAISRGPMRFASTPKVLAERVLKYYRISCCGAPGSPMRANTALWLTLSRHSARRALTGMKSAVLLRYGKWIAPGYFPSLTIQCNTHVGSLLDACMVIPMRAHHAIDLTDAGMFTWRPDHSWLNPLLCTPPHDKFRAFQAHLSIGPPM